MTKLTPTRKAAKATASTNSTMATNSVKATKTEKTAKTKPAKRTTEEQKAINRDRAKARREWKRRPWTKPKTEAELDVPAGPPFPFQKLPVELRLEVYKYLLVHPNPVQGAFKSEEWQRDFQIMGTCKEIYNEAAPIFYGQNNFEFWGGNVKIGGGNEETFRHISKQNAPLVKEVAVRSGTSFLRENLLPLQHFHNLVTLNLCHTKHNGEKNNEGLPALPSVDHVVGSFKEMDFKTVKELPQLPQAVLDRCRDGGLAINFLFRRHNYHPYTRTGWHNGFPVVDAEWESGRVERYKVVDARGGKGTKTGAFGIGYDLVFIDSTAMAHEDDHL